MYNDHLSQSAHLYLMSEKIELIIYQSDFKDISTFGVQDVKLSFGSIAKRKVSVSNISLLFSYLLYRMTYTVTVMNAFAETFPGDVAC